jgi:PAS domain S-box-containing protein
MLVVSGISLVLFVVGLTWFLLRNENPTSAGTVYLSASVLFAAVMLALSVSMLSIANEAITIRRGEELQVHAVQHSPDVIMQLDDNLRIVSVNPAAEKRFGHTADAISGMPVSYLMPEPLAAKRPEPKVAVAEETQSSARRLSMRVGTRLSHLVQPLLGFTEIAIESLEPNHPVRGDLQEIGRASSRVVLLSQALEMYGGVRKPHTETIELNAFLDTLERDLRFVLQPATAIEWKKAGHDVTVTADPGLTRITIFLLACNAEEAMPPGSTISISVGDDGIRVADSGPGVPKEIRLTMFKPLSSTKDAERGVGLGLHAARAAMRLQSADLQLTESGDSGSTLTLVFPRTSNSGAAGDETIKTPVKAPA